MVMSREQLLSREQQLLAAAQQLQAYESITGYVKQPKTVNTYVIGSGPSYTGGSSGLPAVSSLKSPIPYETRTMAEVLWAGTNDGYGPTSVLAYPSADLSNHRGGQWGGLVPKTSPFVTTNRGLETLASSIDVEALDASEAVAMPFQPTATKSLDLMLRSAKMNPAGPSFALRPDRDLAPLQRSNWTPGFRTEMALDANEQILLKSVLASQANAPLENLVRKLWATGNAVCNQTDRCYAQTQRVVTHDLPAMQQAVVEASTRAKNAEAFAQQSQSQVVEQQNKELVVLRQRDEQRIAVCKQLKDALQCPICTEVAVLPKVLGTCGHIACQNCLKQLDDVAFATLTQSGAGASARQHLMARRCPLCRMEIIGAAFPVHPLKEMACMLIAAGYIEVADQVSMKKHIEFKAITFVSIGTIRTLDLVVLCTTESWEKETTEQKHIAALQIGCYAQSQLAQHSVAEVISKIVAEQWRTGVYIMFEAAVSRVFFETFATTLHGRAGGVNVLVNAAQRMLAVQLVERKPKDKAEAKAKTGPHLLVKVATDGRFTITTATPTNAVSKPATEGAAVASGASGPTAATSNTVAAPNTVVPNAVPPTYSMTGGSSGSPATRT